MAEAASAEAQPKKRKRRRIISGETRKDTLSSDDKSCGEACEEDLFRFTNKQSTLEALSEETLKEVQKELLEDCRKEDVDTETDRRWRREHSYKAWNDLEHRFVDPPPSRDHHDSSVNRTSVGDDSDEDDDYLYMTAAGGYQLPPSTQSQTLLSNVSQTLHNLRKRRPPSPISLNDSLIDCTPSSPTNNTDYNITLRIRCKGNIHRYKTLTVKPFSEVVSQLADDLGVVKERILISFNTESVPLNATPDSLGLTTVDFLDALVMEKAITDEPVVSPEDDPNQITIRVQSTTKSVNYRLKRADPLDKVLTAFSSTMEVAREMVKFVFDGDAVEPTSTAEELGLEDDDVIDARVMTDD